MILQIILLLVGFALLIKSADWLVVGASSLAKRYNVSDLAIGLTVVAFGTSAPELVVNTFAAYNNHADIVFGNIIGSNSFNLFAILGIAGLITPLIVQSSTVWKEIPLSLIAMLMLFVLANDFFISDQHILSRIDGIILLIMFCLFLLYVYKQLKSSTEDHVISPKKISTFRVWTLIIIGIGGLVIGGKLVVNNAVLMAISLGISQKVIGLTIVAFGTSLPELATSVVAAMKKNNDIAVGNIIGSNIFNIFLILGVSAVIRPIEFPQIFNIDIWLVIAGTVFLFVAMFTGGKRKLDRWEAALLLVVYVGYTIYLVSKEI
jgi:cation:H+ antiporter